MIGSMSSYFQDAVSTLISLLTLFSFLAVIVLSLVWLERKALGRLQLRLCLLYTSPSPRD